MSKSAELLGDVVMECLNVEKRFHSGRSRGGRVRQWLGRTLPLRATVDPCERPALRNLNLRVNRGQSIAFIGDNGSGKSTALRLIAGIYLPSEGEIRIWGRIAAVIELGVGFNRELTGSENIYLYGAVMGLSRREISDRFDRITAFAEIGDGIERPVKHYSSGMLTRLAFAVAAHVDADILLLDEILAVGDRHFRQRCFDHLHRFRSAGGTLIVVSHQLDVVTELCDEAVWLECGELRERGEVHRVVDSYRGALKSSALACR